MVEIAFSEAPGGVALMGMDGRFLRVNESLCELFGRPAEEIVGSTSAPYTHPDDAGVTGETFNILREGGARVLAEKRYLRPDGEIVWASSTGTAIRGSDGELTYVVSHFWDVTEQRAAEQQLRTSEENLRTVAALTRQLPSHENPRQAICDAAAAVASADMVQLWEPDGPGHLRATAATGTELTPDLRMAITAKVSGTTAAFRTRERQIILDAHAPGAVASPQIRDRLGVASVLCEPVIGRDGALGVLVVMWRAAIANASAQAVGAVGLLAIEAAAAIERADLTARLGAQARAEQMRLRQLLEGAPDAMIISDSTGVIQTVNDQTLRLLGYAREELIGESVDQILPPEPPGGAGLDPDAFAAAPSVRPMGVTRELTARHKDAAEIPVEVTLSPVQTDEGLLVMAAVRDITERRLYETQLRYMADHDPLTGLLNRRSLERELARHVARVKRYGATGAVLMIDLDNFKYYNDTQGHGAGDDLIVRIGRVLQGRLRETDVLVRLGGDEFAVLLPTEDRMSADMVAHDLLALVRREAPAPIHGAARRITASIGIACFADGDHLTGEEVMVNADLAMYEAKENGRNRCAHYSTDELKRPRIESRMKWASEITQALAEDRFELLAQPIVSLQGDGPTQYELLLRMRDTQYDEIPPGTFLHVAERLGLIQEIDRWVIAHAIDMLAEQRAEGRDLRFEVNLSGHSIGDPELLELIERRLLETGVPPDRLVFEITETAAVANIARAGAFARRLAEVGCRFALDDFGAGFGSFYYLKHLPFDYIKIDGEFVRHCATNPTDRTLIAAVVQIARGMDTRTIAEFVGDQESVEVLTELGVDYGQGYFLGRPEAIAQHLARPTAYAPAASALPGALRRT
jgi:diguanylate cyclase (GGDEF)-like protein/PAS domain S-box-containing protein